MSQQLESREPKDPRESRDSNEHYSNEEDSPHFKFDEGGMQKRGRQTGKYLGKVNLSRNFNGYTRPSDYVTYDSDQLTIANNQQDKLACFKKIEISDTKEEIDSRRKSITSVEGNSAQMHSARMHSARLEQPMDVESIKLIKHPDIEAAKRVMQTANGKSNQPFLVEGISSVKKVVHSNERKSEKYILEVLSGMNFQSVPSYEGSARKYSQFIDRMIEPYKQTEEHRKAKEIKDKEDFERRFGLDQNPKIDLNRKIKKRVTINQNGKIKRPTDNLTDESYEEIVPAELKRRASSGLKRERPTDVIEEQQEQITSNKEKHQEQFVFTMPTSTEMVFHLSELEKKNIAAQDKKTKNKNKKKQQRVSPSLPRKKSRSKSRPKSKPRYKARLRSKKQVIAKADSKSKQSSKENSGAKIKSKSQINQSTNQDKSRQLNKQTLNQRKPKKTKEEKQRKKKVEKQESLAWQIETPYLNNTFVNRAENDPSSKAKADKKKEMEPKKKVIKTENEVVVRQVSPVEVNERPQRFRVPRLKYWQCQRLAYSKKVIERIDQEAFLRMIGMKNIQKIGGVNTDLRPKKVTGKFNLRPQQTVQATGFFLQDMEKEWRDIRPKQLTITCMGRKDSIIATIDDFKKMSLNGPLILQEGEELTLYNPTNNMVTINLALE